MSRLQYLSPLLRPLANPRAIASRQHLRFSTSKPWQAEQPKPNTNSSIQPFLPPNASSEHPSSPQEGQRAADLAAAESLTESDSAQSPNGKPILPPKHSRADHKPAKADDVALSSTSAPEGVANTATALKQKSGKKTKTPRAPNISLPPPKYFVSRTASKNLPIYTDYKRGGNLHQTIVRKITGDFSALKDELRVFLNKKNEDVKINTLTGHVIVKGHYTSQIADFLTARGF